MIRIVAELAQGYEGNPELLRLLISAASCAGADAVKAQLVYADELCTASYEHYELFRRLEMPDEAWRQAAASATQLGVALNLDIFGPRSLAIAESIGTQAVKIHGTDMGNVGLLELVARSKVGTVLLGAGGSFITEIDQAVGILERKDVVVLLGFQGYPTPTEANQIDRVRALSDRYRGRPRLRIGFADHADPESPLRYALAAAAIGAGAVVLEKHLTLGRVMKLEDHEAALNPDQMTEFVATIRACDEAMGTTTKADDFGMSDSERGYRQMTRKHVVASRPIRAGERIDPPSVTLKRTPAKNALDDLSAAYGRNARVAIAVDDPIAEGALE